MIVIESTGDEPRDWQLTLMSMGRWMLLIGAIYLPGRLAIQSAMWFLVVTELLNEYLRES